MRKGWRRVTVLLAAALVLLLLLWGYYGFPHLWFERDKSSSPYFGTAQEVSERLGEEFECESIGGTFLRCFTSGEPPQIEVMASGPSNDRIESLVARAASNRQDPDLWLKPALSLLPNTVQKGVLCWVHESPEQDRSSVRRFGGYKFTLYKRSRRPVLVIESPGAHRPRETVLSNLFEPLKPVTDLEAESLAARFAPILRFGEGERFFPLEVQAYRAGSEICNVELRIRRKRPFPVYEDPRIGPCRGPSVGENPPVTCTARARCFLALVPREGERRDVQAHEALDKTLRAAANKRFTVYWHAVRTAPRRVIVEYWLFYSFNNFANQHEGDWEWVAVDVDVSEGSFLALPGHEPHGVKVFYSSHHGGRWRTWEELRPHENVTNNRPIVYVGEGSHANYFEPRNDYPAKECVDSVPLCPGAFDRANGSLCQLDSTRYLVKLPDQGFPGSYGPANYLRANGEVVGPGPEDPRTDSNGIFSKPEKSFMRGIHDNSRPARLLASIGSC